MRRGLLVDGFPKRPGDPGDLVRSSRRALRSHLEGWNLASSTTHTHGLCIDHPPAGPSKAATPRETLRSRSDSLPRQPRPRPLYINVWRHEEQRRPAERAGK